MRRFPVTVDTIVVGAGTAGAAVAGRLAAGRAESTLLLEAGPDYGQADSGRWPRDFLDAASVAGSHDWGYTGEFAGQDDPLQPCTRGRRLLLAQCRRGRVREPPRLRRLGGRGQPRLVSAGPSSRCSPRRGSSCGCGASASAELTPFQRACRDAVAANGIPAVHDLNDLDENAGVAPFPVNIDGGTRVNSAFAYVDPVRDRLIVAGDAPVERVLVRDGRAAGVAVRDGQAARRDPARRGSCSRPAPTEAQPSCSGPVSGPPDELAAIGVRPALDLPGVGRNLHDQTCVEVHYEGSSELVEDDGAPPGGNRLAAPRAGDREIPVGRLPAGVRPAYLPGRRL